MSSQAALAAAVNTIAAFLAHQQVRTADDLAAALAPGASGPCVVVVCASSVLAAAESAFAALADHGRRAQAPVLILCGGIGHSTDHVQAALARHPRYAALAPQLRDQPEARVLQAMMDPRLADGPTVLLEVRSTNCGANAVETRHVLEAHGIASPATIVVAQDPTMCRRTVASFARAYADKGDAAPRLFGWPAFVPRVRSEDGVAGDALSLLRYDVGGGAIVDSEEELWPMRRFVGLVLGEVPRLRDDEGGYGPRGKGFIAHVDIPDEVERSWSVLSAATKGMVGLR